MTIRLYNFIFEQYLMLSPNHKIPKLYTMVPKFYSLTGLGKLFFKKKIIQLTFLCPQGKKRKRLAYPGDYGQEDFTDDRKAKSLIEIQKRKLTEKTAELCNIKRKCHGLNKQNALLKDKVRKFCWPGCPRNVLKISSLFF